MRRLFLRLVIDEKAPKTLTAAEAVIAALPVRGCNVPPVAEQDIDAVSDRPLRELLRGLSGSKIDELRNRVVHKDAYRPTREEAESAHDQARKVLHGLTNQLRLRGDAEWYINGGER